MSRNLQFLKDEEADAWLERNRKELGWRDPVGDLLDHIQINPTSILEIGCANGWRLKKLEQRFDCPVVGLDLGASAVAEARANGNQVVQGDAAVLPFGDGVFDLVIWGFFLYIAEPSQYFPCLAETDRVLRESGCIIIHDFLTARPFKIGYPFGESIFTYRFDPGKLFTAHPSYRNVAEKVYSSFECVTLLQKDTDRGFPAVEVAGQ